MSYKGKYQPINPQKYIGNPTKCIYRSLWERKFMSWCDKSKSVIRWGSEEVIVPYISPVDRRRHRYYPDFIIETKDRNGKIATNLIEIKPKKQCSAPKRPERKTKSYIYESKMWAVNQAKWASAKDYAQQRGWEFRIITEKDLYGRDSDD